MFAFFVNSLWLNYLNNNPTKSPNSIADTMEFLSLVGTPCLLENVNSEMYLNKKGLSLFNGTEGFFVQVANGTAIKFDASLSSNDVETRIRNIVIS